ADERARERHVPLQPGTSGEIDDDARERLVERNVGMAVATDALLVADRARDRLAERDADVLDRVGAGEVRVACALDFQIAESVTRERVGHVVEARHAAGELALAGAVEIDEDPHAGLGGIAADFGAAHRVPEEIGASGRARFRAFRAAPRTAGRSPPRFRPSAAGSCAADRAFYRRP